MRNILYSLIYLNDLKGVLQYWSETQGDALFEEEQLGNILKGVDVLLEGLYVVVIISSEGISMNNFYLTSYLGICTTSVISRGWKVYKTIYEERKLKVKMRQM